MTTIASRMIVSVAISGLMLVLSGCQEPEGPAERAGKQIDQGILKAGQVLEQTGKKIQDAAKEANK